MHKIACFLCLAICFQLHEQRVLYDKQFFVNSMMAGNYFYSSARYKSPSWIKSSNNKLPVDDKLFFTPGNALQLHYVSGEKGSWSADIIYHEIRGVDIFSKATQLVFRLYIQSNTNDTELPLLALGKDSNTFSSFLPVQNYISAYTTKQWLQVSIPLKDFGDKISFNDINIIQFKQQASGNKEHSLYIDQVELLPDINTRADKSAPKLSNIKAYEKHVDITWKTVTDSTIKYIKVYRSTNGKSFYPVGVQTPWINRYADYTDTTGKKFFYKITF